MQANREGMKNACYEKQGAFLGGKQEGLEMHKHHQTEKGGKDQKKQGSWVRSAWDGKGKTDLNGKLGFFVVGPECILNVFENVYRKYPSCGSTCCPILVMSIRKS